MKLGVIGGLGPRATVRYMELITEMTEAKCDQEHLDMIIYSFPSVPDRTGYLLGKSQENPLPELIKLGKALKEQGTDVIALLCMTAHAFHEELQEAVGVPVLNGVEAIACELKEMGIRKVGILATDGALAAGVFQKAFVTQGIEIVLPDHEKQQQLMNLIYQELKAGKEPNYEAFEGIMAQLLHEKEAQMVVLGCTELSLLKKHYEDKYARQTIDALELLAKLSLESCGKKIRKDG